MRYLLPLLLLALSSIAYGQTCRVQGTLIDGADNSTLPGVVVTVKIPGDTTKVYRTAADMDGKFSIDLPAPGAYQIFLHEITYNDTTWQLNISSTYTNIGKISLHEGTVDLKEATVEGSIPLAIQNGDTTQYNADAYKVNKDATAEDLVTKMPGITVENGVVKSNGEDVKKVLVDGKEFFGDDAALTLKNLPADVIDKIQVFDKLSDQAELSGFNDGNTSKTINIITKKDKLNGQFGKIYGGLGTDYRYIAGGNINLFEGSRKISILGLSNNINQQNFSTEDLVGVSSTASSGGGGRGGQGGAGNAANNFLVGQQNGITTTHAAGINYIDTWGKKKNINISGSYFFNATQTVKNLSTNREYLLTADSSVFYKEQNTTQSTNYNHRVNLRMEFNIDSMNSIVFTPKFSFQQNTSTQGLNASNSLSNGVIYNSSMNNQIANRTGWNGGGELLYRHKFAKKGRTFSFNASGNYTYNKGFTTLQSQNRFFTDSLTLVDSVNQQSTQISSGYSIASGISYTEPVGKNGQLSFRYGFGYDWNTSTKNTLHYNAADSAYTLLDSLLSGNFNNHNITNRVTAGYGLRGEKFNFNIGVTYENVLFNGAQLSPIPYEINRIYHNVLPNANFTFRFSKTNNLRITYRTSTGLPTVSQLQPVVNNSNPLLLSTGNQALLRSYTHTGVIRYSKTNTDKATALFASLAYTYTQNYVANATYIAPHDTTLSSGVFLGKGSQLTFPVNLQGYMNARALFTYAFPVKKIKTNISLTTSANYNRLPGLVNLQPNYSNTISLGQGIGFASNISEKIDFNITYNATYNLVKNTIRNQADNNYFNQTASVKVNWQFWKGFFVNTNLSHYYYKGLTGGYDQTVFLWTASAGYKFLKDESLELKATVFDILGQNNSVARTITETYIEDQTSNVLTRYFMVVLTYNLKNFTKADDKKDDKKTKKD